MRMTRGWKYLGGVTFITVTTITLIISFQGQRSDTQLSSALANQSRDLQKWREYVMHHENVDNQDKYLMKYKGKLEYDEYGNGENPEKVKLSQNVMDTGGIGDVRPAILNENDETEKTERKLEENTGKPYFIDIKGDIKTVFHPGTCRQAENSFYLLIGVFSAFHRHELRNAIRQTWGSQRQTDPYQIRTVFIMGNPFKRGRDVSEAIFAESKLHSDMLLLDVEDDYRTLSLKMLGFLHWADKYCKNVKYVLKADDDVFINIPKLVHDLEVMSTNQNLLMGHVIKQAQPIRDKNDKWYMPPEAYSNTMYPNYLSGTAYVMSHDLVHSLLVAAKETKVFWLEDIFFTGFLPSKTVTPLIDNKNFVFVKTKHAGPCFVKNIVSMHEITPVEMEKLYNDLHNGLCNSSSDYVR